MKNSMKILRSSSACPSIEFEDSEARYASQGVEPRVIQCWEDGQRCSGMAPAFEWWYFDAVLSDGSVVVIVFYVQDQIYRNRSRLTFELVRPNGARVERESRPALSLFNANSQTCDVRIGASTFQGNLHDYHIHVEIDDLVADFHLHSSMQAWRPGAGVAVFRDRKSREHHFGWLPSVPRGRVEGALSIAGVEEVVTGTGYHDHNWGNNAPQRLLDHWFWGRANLGEYTILAAQMIASKKYEFQALPVFMLARGDVIVAQDASKVTFSSQMPTIVGTTEKLVPSSIKFDYVSDAGRYCVTFERTGELTIRSFRDKLPRPIQRLAKIVGMNGAYMRFRCRVTLEYFGEDGAANQCSGTDAVWEMMSFT